MVGAFWRLVIQEVDAIERLQALALAVGLAALSQLVPLIVA